MGDGTGPMIQTTMRRHLITGVTGHHREKAEQGYVLFTPMGDMRKVGKVNRTYLIDMTGEVVHEWTHDLSLIHI